MKAKASMPLVLLALGAILSGASSAAPPLDLTDPNTVSDPQDKKKSTLTESDIVFVDDVKKAGATVLLFDVPGRASPTRNAKVLRPLKKGEAVRILKPSQDGRWWTIQHFQTGKKFWIPKSAVRAVGDSAGSRPSN